MSASSAAIREFFAAKRFAVVGASAAKEKYGNKVLRWYIDNNYSVTPVNPKEKTIESLEAVPSLEALTGSPADYSVSVITPPSATKGVLEIAVGKGFKRLWLQPGSEDASAVAAAREKGLLVIADGNCVLRSGIPKPKM